MAAVTAALARGVAPGGRLTRWRARRAGKDDSRANGSATVPEVESNH